MEEIVDLTGGDEIREEERRETVEPGVSGQAKGQIRNDLGAVRKRLIIDESSEEVEEVQFPLIKEQPSKKRVLEEEVVAYRAGFLEVTVEKRARSERKREGKEIAKPIPKKTKRASSTVVIQEPQSERVEIPREEDDSDSDGLYRWELRTKGLQDQAQRVETPQYLKFSVQLDCKLLVSMLEFDDPKMTEDCKQRVLNGKLAKSGKKLHQPSLETIEAEENFLEYITGIGFEWLILDMERPDVLVALAQEFLILSVSRPLLT